MKQSVRILSLFLLTSALAVPTGGRAAAASATDQHGACDRAVLSAITGLSDAHLVQTRHTLQVLARTEAVQSGQWDRMETLVRAAVPPTLKQILWFAQPDGTYYTSAGGLADQKLSDRPYFPRLMAGGIVCGDLVVSKATGKKSVIIAVPVMANGKQVGAMGASIFVDDLSQALNDTLKLPAGVVFYALATNALTAFHINPKLDFVDPRQMDSPSLKQAVETMLGQPSGEVTYDYGGAPRHVWYCTSTVTGWRVAFGRIQGQAAR